MVRDRYVRPGSVAFLSPGGALVVHFLRWAGPPGDGMLHTILGGWVPPCDGCCTLLGGGWVPHINLLFSRLYIAVHERVHVLNLVLSIVFFNNMLYFVYIYPVFRARCLLISPYSSAG